MRRGGVLIVMLVSVLTLMGCGGQKTEQPSGTQAPTPPQTTLSSPQPSTPPSPPSVSKNPLAIVETSMGTFKIELFADKAPHTVQNFIDLVKRGFYKDMIFHRVIAGFVIQTGDPTGTGRGGSERTIKLEIHPDLKHDSAGIVGMARTTDPDSATSQFYITLAPAPHLDGKYAIFGRVIEGMEVLMAIGQVEVGPNDRPVVPVILKSITMQQ
ncbi:MAG: peptidylprolyl isomerase [Candidatus Bipolaricaulota bacterium]|nr:peptidylprolyl isomerase [Candidatus Bipolaricaulota bacterium]MDW8031701.1 peptidylprolyl isomerase [Candidatus Bipolaricaulota bacterium]